MRPGLASPSTCLKPLPFKQAIAQSEASPVPSPTITFEFVVFSTRTGKLADVLRPVLSRNGNAWPRLWVVWSNPSGSVLVAQAPRATGGQR